MGAAIFRSLAEILSSPVAFLVKRDLKLSRTVFSEIIFNWKKVLFWTQNVRNSDRLLVKHMRVLCQPL